MRPTHLALSILAASGLAATASAQSQAGTAAGATASATPTAWMTLVHDDLVRIELDSGRAARLPDGRYMLWLRWYWREQRRGGGLLGRDWVQSLDQWVVDCDVRRFDMRQTLLFDGAGRQVSRYVPEAGDTLWYELLPRSYGELAVKHSCSHFDRKHGAAKTATTKTARKAKGRSTAKP